MQAFTNLALSKIIYLFFIIHEGSRGTIASPAYHNDNQDDRNK